MRSVIHPNHGILKITFTFNQVFRDSFCVRNIIVIIRNCRPCYRSVAIAIGFKVKFAINFLFINYSVDNRCDSVGISVNDDVAVGIVGV